MERIKRYIFKIISVLLIMILIFPSFMQTVLAIDTGGQDSKNKLYVNQEIIKYIPYYNSEEDNGVIIQDKINIECNDLVESDKLELEIENPSYNGIMPVNIEIFTKDGKISQDNKEKEFFVNENNKTKLELKLENESNINKEYYITYKYDSSAYEKYLENAHVTKYEGGSINRIEKDEITGETWVYIDFAWDISQGERPEGKELMDKTKISISANIKIEAKDNIEQENKLEQELDVNISSFINTTTQIDISQISKGNLYANKDINYVITHENNIARSDILKELEIDDSNRRIY